MAPFTEEQTMWIHRIERAVSVFSLACSFFIVWSFARFPYFRKPINILIFFAALGNIMTSVATGIATSGIKAGLDSPLCQTQALLIQWFMPADCIWVFFMAMNVYLVFYHHYDAARLMALNKWYVAIGYGLSSVPAFTFLIVDYVFNENIYGDATMWCWISTKWAWMRMAFFYAPAWILIVSMFTLHGLTGYKVLKHRPFETAPKHSSKRLLSWPARKPQHRPSKLAPKPSSKGLLSWSARKARLAQGNKQINDTTMIRLTTEFVQVEERVGRLQTGTSPGRASLPGNPEAGGRIHLGAHPTLVSLTRPSLSHKSIANTERVRPAAEMERSRCITTISTGHDDHKTGRNGINEAERKDNGTEAFRAAQRNLAARHNPWQGSKASMNYARTAMLMFLAMMIVWVPSTVNRVYSLVHRDEPSYAFSVFAALVLPTQGFWNFLVYVYSSQGHCKTAWAQIKADPRRIFCDRAAPRANPPVQEIELQPVRARPEPATGAPARKTPRDAAPRPTQERWLAQFLSETPGPLTDGAARRFARVRAWTPSGSSYADRPLDDDDVISPTSGTKLITPPRNARI